jgi:hypothetical protein
MLKTSKISRRNAPHTVERPKFTQVCWCESHQQMWSSGANRSTSTGSSGANRSTFQPAFTAARVDDRDAIQTSPDELLVIDIHLLRSPHSQRR